MPMGLLFWILMLFWLLFGAWRHWTAGPMYLFGGDLLLFILLLLLGWQAFGAPLK